MIQQEDLISATPSNSRDRGVWEDLWLKRTKGLVKANEVNGSTRGKDDPPVHRDVRMDAASISKLKATSSTISRR